MRGQEASPRGRASVTTCGETGLQEQRSRGLPGRVPDRATGKQRTSLSLFCASCSRSISSLPQRIRQVLGRLSQPVWYQHPYNCPSPQPDLPGLGRSCRLPAAPGQSRVSWSVSRFSANHSHMCLEPSCSFTIHCWASDPNHLQP